MSTSEQRKGDSLRRQLEKTRAQPRAPTLTLLLGDFSRWCVCYIRPGIFLNCEAEGALLEEAAALDSEGASLLAQASEIPRPSARGYHRVLKVARTIADLADEAQVRRRHLAEALSYRREPQDFAAVYAGQIRGGV
jgi:hypothetical protein